MTTSSRVRLLTTQVAQFGLHILSYTSIKVKRCLKPLFGCFSTSSKNNRFYTHLLSKHTKKALKKAYFAQKPQRPLGYCGVVFKYVVLSQYRSRSEQIS